MSPFRAVFKRDLALAWRAGGGVLAPLGYFLGAALMVALSIGAQRTGLEQMAPMRLAGPALIWVAAALALLTVLERLFQADLEDGALDQMILSNAPLEALVFAKGAALWVGLAAPIALAGAPVAIALGAPPAHVPAIVASLAIGSAGLIGAGLIGAAVSAGVKRGGVLIALIVMPLCAPIVIFGAAVAQGQGFGFAFWMLSGCAAGLVALGPMLAGAALRIQAD